MILSSSSSFLLSLFLVTTIIVASSIIFSSSYSSLINVVNALGERALNRLQRVRDIDAAMDMHQQHGGGEGLPRRAKRIGGGKNLHHPDSIVFINGEQQQLSPDENKIKYKKGNGVVASLQQQQDQKIEEAHQQQQNKNNRQDFSKNNQAPSVKLEHKTIEEEEATFDAAGPFFFDFPKVASSEKCINTSNTKPEEFL